MQVQAFENLGNAENNRFAGLRTKVASYYLENYESNRYYNLVKTGPILFLNYDKLPSDTGLSEQEYSTMRAKFIEKFIAWCGGSREYCPQQVMEKSLPGIGASDLKEIFSKALRFADWDVQDAVKKYCHSIDPAGKLWSECSTTISKPY